MQDINEPPNQLDQDLIEAREMEDNERGGGINYLGAPNIFRIQADDIQADENAQANLRQRN